ncbi:hypothetical protein I4U23_021195 [Adineta vaga]|nr:hypothetical protein I4U23_021195 [Adineta vaga]
MSKYFPDAQTPNLSPFRHQLEVGGQAQSKPISNTQTATNINTVNAGPYIPVFGPTAAQRLPQPIRAPFMAQPQQQQQRPVRPPGPSQIPSGIPSYTSQVEGLSVAQAVVNDVLVDLQSKVINETLQQYQDAPVGGSLLEPLPPIYIQAPQPTIILRSDINRLRTELNSTVRPQVIYRNPADAEQFQQQQQQQQFQQQQQQQQQQFQEQHQQQQFQQQHQHQQQQFQQHQQHTFQAPRFPAPPQQHIPPECYGEYGSASFANR